MTAPHRTVKLLIQLTLSTDLDNPAQVRASSPDLIAAVGGWLFRQRTWLPVPLAAVLLVAPAPHLFSPAVAWTTGALLVTCGEVLRLWAVRHIGAISRTRSDRLGPLVSSGPFALVRNPLYIGNIVLWAGFGVVAADWWVAGLVALALALEYHAIVRWEEQLIARRLGDSYRDYLASVSRWVPTLAGVTRRPAAVSFSWKDTLFSERGTLIAIAAASALLYAKTLLTPKF